jgi:hypothetical protein
MTVFYQTILKVINDYKAMLKKELSTADYIDKANELGIKRNCLKNASDLELYAIGQKIIAELEQNCTVYRQAKNANYYYGAKEFLQYLKKIFSEHVIEDGMVVNTVQKSSCALVKAIQLINQAKNELTDIIMEQLYQCICVIKRYGNQEQREIFKTLLNSEQPTQSLFLFRRLQNLATRLDV